MATAVLPVVRGNDGVLEAVELPVFGGDDVEVRDLDALPKTTEKVRCPSGVKTLEVFSEGELHWVRYDDAV